MRNPVGAAVHHSPRRRCRGGLAAGGRGAADCESADHWVLGYSTPSAWSQWTGAFVQRLRELGWTDGRNIAIEYRWAESRNERFTESAAEFVRLKVDVIVTAGLGVNAAKRATSVIPIVFALANNPVGSGFVASLARPGGNVTGLSTQGTDIAGKRIELLREVVPKVGRLAIMANVGFPDAVLEMDEVEATAKTLGLQLATAEIHRDEDIAPRLHGAQ